MEESLVLSNIKNHLSVEKFVTYFSLQTTFDVSPLESQLLLKKYIDENKESVGTYLNYLTEDNVNHVLAISDCSLPNNSIISLKSAESNVANHIDLYMTNNELDKRNPPIVSDEIHLLSTPSPEQVNRQQPTKQEPIIKSNAPCASKVTNIKKSSPMKKITSSIKEKETKITTSSFFSKNPVNESSSKTKAPVNDDSDFEFSDDSNTFVSGAQVLPVQSKPTCKKIDKKLEVITFNDLTHGDIVCKKSNDNKTKNSVTKPKLFENFENVSPKKRLKRRRLVIESDEEDENEQILVDASFEEAKSVTSLKSHHSKRFKTDNKPKQDEPDTVVKKQVFETFSKPALKKVERTYKDEDGFLVVEKILVPINPEGNVNSVKEKIEIKKSEIPVKLERKIGKKPQSKSTESKGKQTNIMNFFQKN